MNNEVVILITDDDEGHSLLIEKNLRRAGLVNTMLRFADGEDVLNFLLRTGPAPHRDSHVAYLLLLDIRMPRVDGVEVLRQIKADHDLKKMPVIMITTTDDPREIENCHDLGCNSYIAKPIDYDRFVETIAKLGLFLMVVQVPMVNGDNFQ
ncbi:MAG: response regulator [Ignavibacteriales bacterium]|nr:response regulator [Ignavibacteriales bacterium]